MSLCLIFIDILRDFVPTREFTAVHILRLAVHLAVFKVRIAKSRQNILSEATLRNVASVESAVLSRPLLPHLLAKLVSFLHYIGSMAQL